MAACYLSACYNRHPLSEKPIFDLHEARLRLISRLPPYTSLYRKIAKSFAGVRAQRTSRNSIDQDAVRHLRCEVGAF